MDSPTSSNGEVEDLESRRESNIEEKKSMLDKLLGDFLSKQKLKPTIVQHHTEPQVRRSYKRKIHTLKPIRRSTRLRSSVNKQDVDMDEDYLSDPEELFNAKSWSDEEDDLYIVPPPLSNRSSRTSVPIVPEVTEAYLARIATSSVGKKYDPVNGTTCHQCRQKTKDSKTICRGPDCRGVRGFFCGPCLRNRYGEDVRETLLDQNWLCPPCRGICNCSICFRRAGLPCTGILAPSVQNLGYNSVSEYILSKSKKNREKHEVKKLMKELEREVKKIRTLERDDNGLVPLTAMMALFEEEKEEGKENLED